MLEEAGVALHEIEKNDFRFASVLELSPANVMDTSSISSMNAIRRLTFAPCGGKGLIKRIEM